MKSQQIQTDVSPHSELIRAEVDRSALASQASYEKHKILQELNDACEYVDELLEMQSNINISFQVVSPTSKNDSLMQ